MFKYLYRTVLKTNTCASLYFTKFLLTIMFVPLLSGTISSQNNYYVNNAVFDGNDIFCTAVGNNGNNGTTPATPKLTLTNLLATYGPSGTNVLTSGDNIYIDAGTYSDQNLNITVAGLHFIGAGIGVTIFDNNFAGTSTNYFMYISADGVTLTDMTIQKYENQGTQTPGTSGQAITIGGALGVVLTNIMTNQNGQSGGNGAITILSNSDVTINGGGNFCNQPNTLYSGGISIGVTGPPSVVASNTTVRILNCIISLNDKLGFYGGGIDICGNNTTTNVIIDNCRISENRALEGGGIYMTGGNLTVTNSIIEDNSYYSSGGGIYGGGVTLKGGTAIFRTTEFTGNTGGKGGAISVYPSAAQVTLNVDSCLFSGNVSTNGCDIYARPYSTKEYFITCTQTTFSTTARALTENDNSTNTCVGSDFSISDCGDPPTYSTNGGGGASCNVVKVNTNAPTYVPSPAPPTASGGCGSIVIDDVTLSYPTDTVCSTTGTLDPTYSPPGGTFSAAPAGITIDAGSGVIDLSSSATGTYTITYTVAGESATFDVTIGSSISINVSAADATICPGENTTLSANGASSYIWENDATLSAGTGSSVISTPSTSTTYTVTGDDGNGCTNSATVSVSVSVPTVSIVADDATLCNGATAQLTASGAVTYEWSPGTGLSATTGDVVDATPSASITYSVVGTDANGCTNTDAATIAITVFPASTVTATADDSQICEGGSTTLNANGASTYTWSPGTGLSATTGNSVTANPTTSTTYTVNGVDANSCSAASATVTVEVMTSSSVVIVEGDITVCDGSTGTLTATGASTFEWAPNTGISSTTGSPVTVSPAATTTYTVTGYNAQGCSATATATVSIGSVPTVSIVADDATLCNGATAQLTASGAVTYEWSPGTGLSATTG
ncbi:MAG: hypothetical protein KKD31_19425, partial [Bacteroidetes bacterium]|nr:hypothetical protein [Bacteroidota bacterium]